MTIDRRMLLALLGSCIASPALAQAPAMSRQTAYAFTFAGLAGPAWRSPTMPASRSLSSTPPRSAATLRNSPDCSNCGRVTATAAC